MSGIVTRWDVLCNARIVVEGWGWRVFLRALSGRCGTFLVCCCDLRPAGEQR